MNQEAVARKELEDSVAQREIFQKEYQSNTNGEIGIACLTGCLVLDLTKD